MRRLMAILGIELYALALALLQSLGHVRTDEAKYLLNIPYPHPPLARWVFHLTEAWSFQEMFWRIVLATLLTQAVWIVWSMARGLAPRTRAALSAAWLCSAAIAFQAGTIMMAPLTALQGLIFVWLWMREDLDAREAAPWIAFLWLASLFTAYQAVLFLPMVLGLLRRAHLSWLCSLCIAGVPFGLAALYALSNPLSLASFVNAGTDNQGMAAATVFAEFLCTWVLAGSGALLIAGIVGMLLGRRWMLLGTFLLVSVYNLASVHLYYAVLFTPLLIAGSLPLLRRFPSMGWPIAVLTALGTIALWPAFHPVLTPDPTRAIMATLHPQRGGGDVLISGSFGHDWQYESPVPVRAFTEGGLAYAQLVLCWQKCPHNGSFQNWSSAQIGEWEAYMRP